MNEIVAAIFENFEETTLYSAMPFLWELAKVFPKVTYRTPLFILLLKYTPYLAIHCSIQEFSSKSVDDIASVLTAQGNSYGLPLMPLSEIAPANVDDVIKHDDVICGAQTKYPMMVTYTHKILVVLARSGKEKGVKYMRSIAEASKTADATTKVSFVQSVSTIGLLYQHDTAEQRDILQGEVIHDRSQENHLCHSQTEL